MYGDFILLSLQHPGRFTCAVGEKKCAVFAQFWEVLRSIISHNTIDNQCGYPQLRRNKKLRSWGELCGAFGAEYPLTINVIHDVSDHPTFQLNPYTASLIILMLFLVKCYYFYNVEDGSMCCSIHKPRKK